MRETFTAASGSPFLCPECFRLYPSGGWVPCSSECYYKPSLVNAVGLALAKMSYRKGVHPCNEREVQVKMFKTHSFLKLAVG